MLESIINHLHCDRHPWAESVEARAERILLGIDSTRIAVDEDGTARAMTLAELEDWYDWDEQMEREERLTTRKDEAASAE